MIKKERTIPIIILMLQALLRRIAPFHPKRGEIEESLRKYESGYRGEVSIDYYLDFLPDKEVFILHDLRLHDNLDKYFQIDTLILTPRFIIILDVKNHAGTLTIDPLLHQMTQTYKDKNYVYEDPVLQGNRHEQQLREWLTSHNFPQIPVVSLVVFSHPSVIINLTSNHPQYLQKIFRPTLITEKFNKLVKTHRERVFSVKECNKLSRHLIKNHESKKWNVLKMFDIDPSEIIFGVHCPKCFAIPMKYQWGIWGCGICEYESKDAYIETLNDFMLLLGDEITNSMCRQLLQMDSIYTVSRALKNLDLSYSGTFKNRVYYLNYPIKMK